MTTLQYVVILQHLCCHIVFVHNDNMVGLLCSDSDVLKSDHLVFVLNRVAESCMHWNLVCIGGIVFG